MTENTHTPRAEKTKYASRGGEIWNEHEDRELSPAEIINALNQREKLHAALTDMRSGWRYIRDTHGDLHGVGWDRCESSATEALGDCEQCGGIGLIGGWSGGPEGGYEDEPCPTCLERAAALTLATAKGQP
ncbi:MAG: hypothetical protein JWO82_3770 [Akkermansiaceae bacterium]|nr:hypothetical protein [Akkermansiaceae bacterium]